MAHFEQETRSASLKALDRVELFVLDLEKIPREDPTYAKILLYLSKGMSQRLRRASENLTRSLIEKLKLTKAGNQISEAIIHIMILFGLFINLSKVVTPERFPHLFSVFPSLSILAFGLSSIYLIKTSEYPLCFYGLTFEKWWRHVVEAFMITLPILAVITLIKFFLIMGVHDFRKLQLFVFIPKKIAIEDYSFFLSTYLMLVPVQELVSRSFLQSCFRNFFHGRYRAFFAILTSNLLFEMAHTIHHLSFAIASFGFGIFWGYLFEKQKSIIGVCISHALIGAWTFFILDLDAVFKIMG